MEQLLQIQTEPWLNTFFWLCIFIGLRYLLVATLPYWIFYKTQLFSLRKIDPRPPRIEQIYYELFWSMVSVLFFAGAALALIFLWTHNYAVIQDGIGPYGLWYLPLNFLLLVLAHETYFYFTHRWLHRPGPFRRIHYVHHESKNPTPFAAFSFHPIEAAIEAAALPLLALLIPSNLFVFFCFLLFMSILGVTNHLGYELYPNGTARHWFGRWWIGAVHHQQHHTKYNSNFGLYFNFWDRLFSTQNPHYEEAFDSAKERQKGCV